MFTLTELMVFEVCRAFSKFIISRFFLSSFFLKGVLYSEFEHPLPSNHIYVVTVPEFCCSDFGLYFYCSCLSNCLY